MKIRCDVCDRKEASVFCSADEAALCDGCDRRVHHANKLAGKHPRFSLLQPTFKDSPLCDICQEKRAYLFCQEDRAILCRECDISIHRVNEHTEKHNRFLVTGVKLAACSSLSNQASSASTSSLGAAINATDSRTQPSTATATKRSRTVPDEISSSASVEINALPSSTDNASYSISSISEYLMETLPGWHVEDFLDPAFASNGFCKTKSPSLPCVDDDFESNKSTLSGEEFSNWVPQLSPKITSLHHPNNGILISAAEYNEVKADHDVVFNQTWDDIYSTVPQIIPPSFKRHRCLH